MKVAHVVGPLETGGAQTQLFGLIRAAREGHWDPILIGTGSGDLVDEAHRLGVPVHVLPRRGSPGLGRIARLRSLIAEVEPDVVNPHLWAPIVQTQLALLGRGRPAVVAVEHNYEQKPPVGRRILDRVLAGQVDRFVGVTAAMTSYTAEAHGLNPAEIPFIPYGIDRRVFRPGDVSNPPSSTVIFGAGRLAPEKGWPVLVEAVRLLVRRGVDVHVRLAGVGPLHNDLAELACDLPVELIGRVEPGPDMAAEMRRANVVVLPSLHREARPVVLLEAICAGTPVVATDIPGVAETIAGAGVLVEPGDASALAGALTAVITDRDRWDDRVNQAAAQIPSFDSLATEYRKVFEDVLARRGAR